MQWIHGKFSDVKRQGTEEEGVHIDHMVFLIKALRYMSCQKRDAQDAPPVWRGCGNILAGDTGSCR